MLVSSSMSGQVGRNEEEGREEGGEEGRGGEGQGRRGGKG